MFQQLRYIIYFSAPPNAQSLFHCCVDRLGCLGWLSCLSSGLTNCLGWSRLGWAVSAVVLAPFWLRCWLNFGSKMSWRWLLKSSQNLIDFLEDFPSMLAIMAAISGPFLIQNRLKVAAKIFLKSGWFLTWFWLHFSLILAPILAPFWVYFWAQNGLSF